MSEESNPEYSISAQLNFLNTGAVVDFLILMQKGSEHVNRPAFILEEVYLLFRHFVIAAIKLFLNSSHTEYLDIPLSADVAADVEEWFDEIPGYKVSIDVEARSITVTRS